MIEVGETQHYNCDGCGKSKYDGHMVTIGANDETIVMCHDCTRETIELLKEYVGEESQ